MGVVIVVGVVGIEPGLDFWADDGVGLGDVHELL